MQKPVYISNLLDSVFRLLHSGFYLLTFDRIHGLDTRYGDRGARAKNFGSAGGEEGIVILVWDNTATNNGDIFGAQFFSSSTS